MNNYTFVLKGNLVNGIEARNYMVEIYKKRGFSENEAKYFFNECLRDDVIGIEKRKQLNGQELIVTLVKVG